MSHPSDDPSPPFLCSGNAIEYKAYARTFTPESEWGVLYLVATCWFGRGNLSLFFERTPEGFDLMAQSLPGRFDNLDTYYIAAWPPKGAPGLVQLPPEVIIRDAHGEHHVEVSRWF